MQPGADSKNKPSHGMRKVISGGQRSTSPSVSGRSSGRSPGRSPRPKSPSRNAYKPVDRNKFYKPSPSPRGRSPEKSSRGSDRDRKTSFRSGRPSSGKGYGKSPRKATVGSTNAFSDQEPVHLIGQEEDQMDVDTDIDEYLSDYMPQPSREPSLDEGELDEEEQ